VAANTLTKLERDEQHASAPGMLALAFDALDHEHALAIEPVIELLNAQIEKLQATRDALAQRMGK
jgi:hypothetical protein